MEQFVEVVEAYRNYTAPRWVRRTVERQLRAFPRDLLGGLKTVVLTDAGGLNHDRRRAKTRSRGEKMKIREARGLYHEKWQGEPAWIELFIDNILSRSAGLTWIGFLRDLLVGEVLAHEVGHHIHTTKAPEFKEREDVADEWGNRLLGRYLMRRYWYFFPLLAAGNRLCKWAIRPLKRFRKRHKRKPRRARD